jgi:hypothetical protein
MISTTTRTPALHSRRGDLERFIFEYEAESARSGTMFASEVAV